MCLVMCALLNSTVQEHSRHCREFCGKVLLKRSVCLPITPFRSHGWRPVCPVEGRAFQRSVYGSAVFPWSLSRHSPAYIRAVARKPVCGCSKVQEVQSSGRWRGEVTMCALTQVPCVQRPAQPAPCFSYVLTWLFPFTSLSPWLTFSLLGKVSLTPPYKKLQPSPHQWHSSRPLTFFSHADQHLTYSTVYLPYLFIGCLPPVGYWLHRERLLSILLPVGFPEQRTVPNIQ